MPKYTETAIHEFCRSLRIDSAFFSECLQESVIEIREIEGRLDMGNGTALRLRQLERICGTLNVDVPTARLVLDLANRIAELEENVRRLENKTKKVGE